MEPTPPLSRDRLLATAFGLAALTTVLAVAGTVVRFVYLLDYPGVGTELLELALSAVGSLLLVAAYGVGRRAFKGAVIGRWRLLALAAMLATAGYALHAASAWIDFVDTAGNISTSSNHELASILQACSETVIVIVALAAVAAFRRSGDVVVRDGRLAGAACLAVGVNVLAAASAGFYAALYFQFDLDSVARELLVEAIGGVLLAIAAALAMVAFLRSRRSSSAAADQLLDRERTLAHAAVVYAVGTLGIAIGEALAVAEGYGVGVDGAYSTSLWLITAARFGIVAAALVAAAAFALGGWGEDARVRLEKLIRVVRGRPRQQ